MNSLTTKVVEGELEKVVGCVLLILSQTSIPVFMVRWPCLVVVGWPRRHVALASPFSLVVRRLVDQTGDGRVSKQHPACLLRKGRHTLHAQHPACLLRKDEHSCPGKQNKDRPCRISRRGNGVKPRPTRKHTSYLARINMERAPFLLARCCHHLQRKK